ncbi:MAG: type II secretion system F family protein [Phycisphaerales bacterium]
MKFAYRAYDKAGKTLSGAIESGSTDSAREALKSQGLFVTEIKAGGVSALSEQPTRAGVLAFFTQGGRFRDVALLFRQISVLIATGTPVVEALLVQERQIKPGPWKDAVADVRKRVEEGSALSEAMNARPEYFDAVCRSLVAAGESRGKLGEMLQRLATLMRQQMRVRSALLGAMVYPCLLIVVAVAVMAMMMGFVLPRFTGLFETLGAPLPPTTQVLMTMSAWLTQWWWAALAALIGGGFAAKLWLDSESGHRAIDTFMVRAPQIGRIVRAMATARIARVLGVLLEGKVTLLDALALTRQATTNSLYRQLILRAEDGVTRGEPVSAAFADESLISQSFCEGLRAGERTGQVAPVLLTLADFLDEDNEVVVKSITSILEPLILIGLGIAVGFVAVSMFMPLFDLAGAGTAGGG